VRYQTTCRGTFRRLTRGLTSAQRMFYADDQTREGFAALCRRPSIRKIILRYLQKDVSPWSAWSGVKAIGQNVLTLLLS
jgi:hypothetical protein